MRGEMLIDPVGPGGWRSLTHRRFRGGEGRVGRREQPVQGPEQDAWYNENTARQQWDPKQCRMRSEEQWGYTDCQEGLGFYSKR